jgi:hypothetical protein
MPGGRLAELAWRFMAALIVADDDDDTRTSHPGFEP